MNVVRVAVGFLLLSTCAFAQCAKDYRSDKKSGLIINDLVLQGTRSLTSTELGDIESAFVNSCFDNNTEKIGERVAFSFREQGYFMAEIQTVSTKTIDPLAIPKRADVEVKVVEGPLCTLSTISFEGNQAFSAEKLREQFPLKPGGAFKIKQIRSGLENFRKMYAAEGYLDVVPVPEIVIPASDASVSLMIALEEGKQYRMGKLEILGREDLAGPLYANWTLAEGEPYDGNFLSIYVEANQGHLPSGFDQKNSVTVVRDCRDYTITVRLFLESPKVPPPTGPAICREKEKS